LRFWGSKADPCGTGASSRGSGYAQSNAGRGDRALSSGKEKELGAVVPEIECAHNQSRGSPKGSPDSGAAGLLHLFCHRALSDARPVPNVRLVFCLVRMLFGYRWGSWCLEMCSRASRGCPRMRTAQAGTMLITPIDNTDVTRDRLAFGRTSRPVNLSVSGQPSSRSWRAAFPGTSLHNGIRVYEMVTGTAPRCSPLEDGLLSGRPCAIRRRQEANNNMTASACWRQAASAARSLK
jgi:hypothetical protein